MLHDVRKEDRTNETCQLGHEANLEAPNCNNNNNNNNINIKDVNMFSSFDNEGEVELDYEMSDEEYDSYYHNELFIEYKSPPSPKRVHNLDLAPITLLVCNTIQGHVAERLLVILLNGGSSSSLIKKIAIPKGAVATRSDRSHITTTASGSFNTSLTVRIKNIYLPKFSN